jgi:hypothetical protein
MMILEAMTVKEFLCNDSAADKQGDKIQEYAQEVMGRTESTDRMYHEGQAPRFTGFKIGIEGVSQAFYEIDHNDVIFGQVQFCGQWVWRNPNDLDEILAVTVPSMKRSRCRKGERFDIGDVFFTGDEDAETVRETVLAGRTEIERFAVEAWFKKVM